MGLAAPATWGPRLPCEPLRDPCVNVAVSAGGMTTFTIGGDLEVAPPGLRRHAHHRRRDLGPARRTPTRRRPCCAARVELGVNLIDTADSYGPEVSEKLIAEALHPYPDGPRDRHQGRPAPHRSRRVAARRAARAPARVLRGQPAAAASSTASTSTSSTRPTRRCRSRTRSARSRSSRTRARSATSASRTCRVERARARPRASSTSSRCRTATTSTDRHSEDVLDACERDGHRLHPLVPARHRALARPGGAARRGGARARRDTRARSRSRGCSAAPP